VCLRIYMYNGRLSTTPLSSSVVKLLYFIMLHIYLYIRYIWYHAPIKILYYSLRQRRCRLLKKKNKKRIVFVTFNAGTCIANLCVQMYIWETYRSILYRYTSIYDILLYAIRVGIRFSCDTTCKIIFDVTCAHTNIVRGKKWTVWVYYLPNPTVFSD